MSDLPAGSIVVAIEGGRRSVVNGNGEDDRAHEFGSLAKLVTCLAVLHRLKGAQLDSRDDRLLKVGRNGRGTCSVRHLLQHRSGLPTLHESFRDYRSADPYAETTVASLYSSFERKADSFLVRSLRGHFLYSNFGFAIVGHRIAEMTGSNWATMAGEALEILDVEGVWTGCPPSEVPRREPRDANGRAVPWWSPGAYAPAGGLCGTIKGLEGLARGFMNAILQVAHPAHGEAAAMVNDVYTHRRASLGLAWHRVTDRESHDPVVWHNGATGGSWSVIGLRPHAKRAVIGLGVGPPSDDNDRSVLQRLGDGE